MHARENIKFYINYFLDFSEVIKREPNDPYLYFARALIKINNINQIKSGCKDLKKAVSLGYPANKGVNLIICSKGCVRVNLNVVHASHA